MPVSTRYALLAIWLCFVTVGGLRWTWVLLLAATFVMLVICGETFLAIAYYYGVLAYNAQGSLPALHANAAARVFEIIASRMPPLAVVLWPVSIAAQAVLCGMVAASWCAACAKMRLSHDAPLP